MSRPFKIYYQFGSNDVVETQFCCKVMKDYWNMGVLFFNPEDLQVMSRDGIIFNGCPNCRRKIIIKESRL